MTWKEKYQPGKFRDAEFVTESSGRSGGRRLAKHEYPLRDLPYIEDMGRKARQFTLSLFVLGAGYMEKRDLLVKAFEENGSGTLIHPYYGSMTVAVESYRVRETTREGGRAQFDVTFIEAGENTFPSASSDTAAAVKTKSDSALTAIKDRFKDTFSVDKKPEFIATAASNIVSDISDLLSQKVTAFPAQPDNMSAFLPDLNSLSSNASALVRTPANLASSTVSLFQNVAGLYQKPANALNVYRKFYDYGSTLPNVPSSTVIREQQTANQTALTNLVEQTALIESARAASDIEFASFDEAIAVRDELDDALDEQMLVADDNTYRALNDMRVAMIHDISTRSADLAKTVNFTPKATLPALVVAHHLYGDATQENTIIDRNPIRHPGFITGGEVLEVLTSAV